jgi:hypothetical protein
MCIHAAALFELGGFIKSEKKLKSFWKMYLENV